MNNLVNIVNGEATVTSRQVAENFGKEHKAVLRSIRDILTSAQNCTDLFRPSVGQDSYGRSQDEYIMNRDGFTLLAMGFTGSTALQWKLKYIAAFNAMEEKLRNTFVIPQTLSQALLLASQQAQVIEEQSLALANAKPKTEYYDKLCDKGLLTNFRDTAKELGVRQKVFMSFLEEHGYIYRDNSGKPKPYADKMEYFGIKDYSDKSRVGTQVFVTVKGKQKFAKELAVA